MLQYFLWNIFGMTTKHKYWAPVPAWKYGLTEHQSPHGTYGLGHEAGSAHVEASSGRWLGGANRIIRVGQRLDMAKGGERGLVCSGVKEHSALQGQHLVQ